MLAVSTNQMRPFVINHDDAWNLEIQISPAFCSDSSDSSDMHISDRSDTCISDRELLTPYVMTPETVISASASNVSRLLHVESMIKHSNKVKGFSY